MASDMESLISELLAKCYHQLQRRASVATPGSAFAPEEEQEELL
jgi:hypothetical protein